jgi:tol-pal system protein YbgF
MTYRLSALALLAALLFVSPSLAQQRGTISADYAASLETRIQALEQQLARMMGQVEQAQYQARMAQDRLARLEEDMSTRFRMMESQQSRSAPPPAPTPYLDSDNDNPPITPPSRRPPQNDSEVLGQLTSGAGADLPNNPAKAYDTAFRLIRNQDYDAAESAMATFLKRWPKHELASNASYWLGETFYVRGNFDDAVKTFANTYQTYPKGSKSEDTLLKLALSLAALSRDDDACTTFDQLQDEFPRMNPNNRRRMDQERQTLNCPKSSGANR